MPRLLSVWLLTLLSPWIAFIESSANGTLFATVTGEDEVEYDWVPRDGIHYFLHKLRTHLELDCHQQNYIIEVFRRLFWIFREGHTSLAMSLIAVRFQNLHVVYCNGTPYFYM